MKDYPESRESIVWKDEREKHLKERSDPTNTRMLSLDLTSWRFGVSSLIIYMPKKYMRKNCWNWEIMNRNEIGPEDAYRQLLKKKELSWGKWTCGSRCGFKDSRGSRQATWKGERFSRNLITANCSKGSSEMRRKKWEMEIRGVRGSVKVFTEGKQRRKLDISDGDKNDSLSLSQLWPLKEPLSLCYLIKSRSMEFILPIVLHD